MLKPQVKLVVLLMNKLKLSLILSFTALILTGCIPGLVPSPTPTPQPTPTVQSTGNVDEDLTSIDAELEQDSDIPDINNTDLGL